jgi:phosphate transport system substrate-binding protein
VKEAIVHRSKNREILWTPGRGGTVKFRRLTPLLLAAVLCGSSVSCLDAEDGTTLQGAGATFPAPLYKRWFLEYYKLHPDVRVNYQGIGSGAGIRQFTSELVHFGASDAAMSDKEIEKVKQGVELLPMTAGSIAICFNIPGGPTELRLASATYANIFLGNITSWDDPAIAGDNPGVSLPDLPITVVRRAEGSGTTYAFSNHLAAVSEEWKKERGVDKSIKWPKGMIGARGNSGVAALIKQTPGGIGYLEYGYADLSHLPIAALKNRAGKFVKPSEASGRAALASAKFPDTGPPLRIWLPNPDGDDAYPIVTYTWLLCYKHNDDPAVAAELKNVIKFCLTDGQQYSAKLGYIPMPENVVARVLEAVDRITP